MCQAVTLSVELHTQQNQAVEKEEEGVWSCLS